MNNPLDITRHLEVFSPDAFGQRRIDVIGAGAIGSHLVFSLAKLGLEDIHVFDFDKVEPHNLSNQAYGPSDIGRLKVDALADLIKQQTGLTISTHAERVDGTQINGEVVFLALDTMAAREEIWRKGIRYKLRTKLMIETRMGKDEGRVYAVNPSKPAHVRGWEGTLYDDAFAEVSACGATISVGPTALFNSSLAVWQLIRWAAIEQGKEDTLDNEIIFGLRPLYWLTRQFE